MNAILQKYQARVQAIDSLVCVGLDPDPAHDNRLTAATLFAFGQRIIDATHPYAAAYKLNVAFYEAFGAAGVEQMARTVEYLRAQQPQVVTICDAKRADLGNTSKAYARAVFDHHAFDAVTLNPYMGYDALQPFLSYADRLCIILCRTSNEGASDIQDLPVVIDGVTWPLWQVVARRVHAEWNAAGNCALVMGATAAEQLQAVRQIVGDMLLLVPGIGAQGGDVAQTLALGRGQAWDALMINASRSIIFAADPAAAALALRDQINAQRQQAPPHTA
jgi:orotidine-5'-phosphate decarboxylase